MGWISRIRSTVESNRAWASFWIRHIPDLRLPLLDVDNVEQILRKAKAEFDALLSVKKDALFRSVPFGPSLDAAISSWTTESESLQHYSATIQCINRKIEDIRAQNKAGDFAKAERELAELRYTKLRYTDEAASDCEQYLQIEQEKALVNRRITEQREANSEAIKSTFDRYGKLIDKYLHDFGAGFRIKDLVQTKFGGVLRANYSIGLANDKIPLGNPDTSISERSFRNVLSEGDKRSLALAFFLSQLDQLGDEDIEDKIIVFDDPVTSMDDNRRNRTVLEIGRLAKRSEQVFVLSHRPEFLHSIWYRFCRHGDGQIGSTHLELRGIKDSSKLLSWNMEATVASLHAKRIRRVLDYHNDESDRQEDEISGELRPLLDYHYKIHYPEYFERHNISTIGEFARILDSNSPDPVVRALADSDKTLLAGLNIVHRETMHGQDPEPEPLTRAELKSDCAIVLKLLGRREIQLSGLP